MAFRKRYRTNKDLEKTGITLQFDDLGQRIVLARAGGANDRYNKRVRELTKHITRLGQGALEPGPMEEMAKLSRQAFIETCVLKWETLVDGEWVQGIEKEDMGEPGGGLADFNPANVAKVFDYQPDLYTELSNQVGSHTRFLEDAREAELGN